MRDAMNAQVHSWKHPDLVCVSATQGSAHRARSGDKVKRAAHAQAARDWLAFIRSPESLKIFAGYGFKPYVQGTNPP